LSETAEKRKGGYGSSLHGGKGRGLTEFASRRSGSLAASFLSFPLARSIDGRNSDRVADGADRYRRFSSSSQLAAFLVKIARGGLRDGRTKTRRDEQTSEGGGRENGKRAMVWV